MKEAFTFSAVAASAALIALVLMAAIMLVAWPATVGVKYEAEPAVVEVIQPPLVKKQPVMEQWPGRRKAK